jgi:hypothetical protein
VTPRGRWCEELFIARKYFEVYSSRTQQIATPPLALHQAESLNLESATDDNWRASSPAYAISLLNPAPSKATDTRPTLLKHRPIAHFVGRDQTLVDIHEKLFLDRRTRDTLC